MNTIEDYKKTLDRILKNQYSHKHLTKKLKDLRKSQFFNREDFDRLWGTCIAQVQESLVQSELFDIYMCETALLHHWNKILKQKALQIPRNINPVFKKHHLRIMRICNVPK